ncbi:MAG: diguanylate cyclase [Firmicutes bacterium]|nr:diguanylate cyclase [Bacillota bacterium]
MDSSDSSQKRQRARRRLIKNLSALGNTGDYNRLMELAVDELTDRNEQLMDEHQRLKDIVSFLPVATFAIDLEHRVTAWNHAMEKLTGVKSSTIMGKGDYEYAIPFYGTRTPMLIDLILNPEPGPAGEYRSYEKKGEQLIAEFYCTHLKQQRGVYIWGNASPLRDRRGRLVGAIGCVRDITKETLEEFAIEKTRKTMAAIIEFLPDPMMVIDKRHRVIAWNQAMEQLTGVPAEKMLGKGNYAYSVPFYRKRVPVLIDYVLDPDPGLEQKYGILRRDGDTLFIETYIPDMGGREVYLWAKAAAFKDQNGDVVGAIETMRDISELKKAQRELEYLSSFDSLTGLYNRASFDKALQKAEEEMIRPVTLIVCDVNGLKKINDEHGHGEGDRWLRLVAETISGALRPNDMVARIGGDEFGILLPGVGFKPAEKIVERINRSVKDFNRNRQHPYEMSLAIGKATAELPEHLVMKALRTADQNMYLDKKIKKKQI